MYINIFKFKQDDDFREVVEDNNYGKQGNKNTSKSNAIDTKLVNLDDLMGNSSKGKGSATKQKPFELVLIKLYFLYNSTYKFKF